MPLPRRSSSNPFSHAWPGFVDVMSNILILVLFVLFIFMIFQFFLSARLSSSDSRLAELTSLLDQKDDHISRLNDLVLNLEGRIIEERQQSLQATQTITSLDNTIAVLKEEIVKLNQVLQASEARDQEQKVQIVELSSQLNRALAQKAAELARYRSSFFQTLSEALGNHSDFRVDGDRFIFQSEVLFDSGSAVLKSTSQLDKLAKALLTVSKKIPADLPWVLRVDGHTDHMPIHTKDYPSNWELSTARAISVVKYLEKKGVPSQRLAATGFGEHQPLSKSLRANRRIEFKLTEN